MKKILTIMAVVLVSGIVSAQNMFTNGDFEGGTLDGWTIADTGPNGWSEEQGVVLFDIDFMGPLPESLGAYFEVGLRETARGTFAGIEMTQDLTLTAGLEYAISFDFAASYTGGGNFANCGYFDIIIDGVVFDTGEAGTCGSAYETSFGSLSTLFTPTSSGVHTVGVRITRRGAAAFNIFQHIDNALAIGPEETVVPDMYNLFRGLLTGGGLADLLASDDSWMTVQPGITLNQAERPVQLVIEGTAPTEAPSELRIRVEAHADINNIGQWIDLWNYDTSSYEQVDFMIATTADSVVEVSITVDPGRFIEAGTKKMKARISYKEAGIVLLFPWLISFDQTVWVIVP